MASRTLPVNVTPGWLQRFSGLLRFKWFRELILLRPSLTGARRTNKTEDYGVFRPSLANRLASVGLYVSDLSVSRRFYEEALGMTHARSTPSEPHPTQQGVNIECCYMSASSHPECLVLIRQTDARGELIKPTAMSMFHTAFQIEGDTKSDILAYAAQLKEKGFKLHYGPAKHNNEPPWGDGETGGNFAVYIYDPDYHNIEIFAEMDTVENYRDRYGEGPRH
ncbi:MAG: VOC family protein [Pseudomonadota bacterium]